MITTQHSPQESKIPPLRLLAWEVTRRCNLACLHCRAAAGSGPYPGELTTAEGKELLDDLAVMGQIVVILTGGEPLLRDDIFDLAAYGTKLGHRMVMAVNGTLLTPAIATQLKDAGIQRLSISIDGATAASHDHLRAVEGAYAGALAGIAACQAAGLPFQINTTVTRANRAELPAIHELALNLSAAFKMAKKLARQFGAKIVLLHVIQQRIVARVAEHLKVEPDSLLPAFREEAQLHLDEFMQECCCDSLEVTSMVTVGIPFQEIAMVARDLAADLIVMGGYGRSGRGPIEEVFFGSTAEKVVRLLPCPVLCVPWESQAATAQNPL